MSVKDDYFNEIARLQRHVVFVSKGLELTGLANIGYQLYIIFAIFNAAIIPCIYFYFPETKGRSLEELDVIFANSYHEKTGIVKEARETPKLYGEELDAEMARLFPDASGQSESNPEKRLHQRFAGGQKEMESRV